MNFLSPLIILLVCCIIFALIWITHLHGQIRSRDASENGLDEAKELFAALSDLWQHVESEADAGRSASDLVNSAPMVAARALCLGSDLAASTMNRGATRNVHIVAWRYRGGSGFDWYTSRASADAAFTKEKDNARELAADDWAAYRFEYSPEATDPSAITAEIDGHIEDLMTAALQGAWRAAQRDATAHVPAT